MKRILMLLYFVQILTPPVTSFSSGEDNEAAELDDGQCQPGIFLPVWKVQRDLSVGDRLARGLVYLLVSLYFMIGLFVVSHRVMTSIEIITRKTQPIKVQKQNGEELVVHVKVWNETVATFTLMALGCSAPDLILSIVDIFSTSFQSGDLGPSGIVNGSAFSLLIFTALCVYVVPPGEVKKLKHPLVFAVTSIWLVFAYLWLCIILKIISPGVIELWEGVTIFLVFPATVFTAYIAVRLERYKVLNDYNHLEGTEWESQNIVGKITERRLCNTENEKQLEEYRLLVMNILESLTHQFPDDTTDEINAKARKQLDIRQSHSRVFYRMLALQKLTGCRSLMRKAECGRRQRDVRKEGCVETQDVIHGSPISQITIYIDHSGAFTSEETVFVLPETKKSFQLRVQGTICGSKRVGVSYTTVRGSAIPGRNYVHCEGEFVLKRNEAQNLVTIKTLQENYQVNELNFYVTLNSSILAVEPHRSLLVTANDELHGRVAMHGEYSEQPHSNYRLEIRLKGNKTLENKVDELVKFLNVPYLINVISWKEQFSEAITISAGADTEHRLENSVEEYVPSCRDYLVFSCTVFWKILAAFIPPLDIGGGYAALVVSLLMATILTTTLQDLRFQMGCTIGLKDSVTSNFGIFLILPDIVGSRIAAVEDRFADPAVGFIPGTCAVNVFFGVGMTWTLASIYHKYIVEVNDNCFRYNCGKFYVDPGSLAYSVTIFGFVAVVALAVIFLRRYTSIGGELGGPQVAKYATSILFILLWFLYITMCSLEAYGFIQGF